LGLVRFQPPDHRPIHCSYLFAVPPSENRHFDDLNNLECCPNPHFICAAACLLNDIGILRGARPLLLSRFVSALIYGPFVYSCVHVRILFEQSAYLASRFCYFAPQCNTLRSPAFRILCALKSQFRRDLPGSKNLRTHYKRIIFS